MFEYLCVDGITISDGYCDFGLAFPTNVFGPSCPWFDLHLVSDALKSSKLEMDVYLKKLPKIQWQTEP